jgi:hypothetical protein
MYLISAHLVVLLCLPERPQLLLHLCQPPNGRVQLGLLLPPRDRVGGRRPRCTRDILSQLVNVSPLLEMIRKLGELTL